MTPIGSLWNLHNLLDRLKKTNEIFLLTETNGLGGNLDRNFWEWYKKYSGNLTNEIHKVERKMKIKNLLKENK